MSGAQKSVRIAILGAGLSGICMAILLKKRGYHDFLILEKAERAGGTWRENTYPGIACDVPSHLYSYSFELNPDWSHSYGAGPEIWAYTEKCIDKYDLGSRIRYGQIIEGVHFDGKRWTVTTAEGLTVTADVVVSGLGGLHIPKHADIEGIDSFDGPLFHTAEWDHSCDLTGKKVAIIGTGASAVQVLPSIAPIVKDVTVFQRSAAWVFPRVAREIPDWVRTMFRTMPFTMRLYRSYLWVLMDIFGMAALRRGGWAAPRMKQLGLRHLEKQVKDPELRAKLTPDYEPGCKRRCISDDYLLAYNRENVHLVTDAIARIEPQGIRDAQGTLHDFDVIIEATGFRPFDVSDYVSITGRNGVALKDVWSTHVESFRTMMVPEFPNFFLLLGPNSGTGHTSALIMIESQARYVAECLRLMNEKGISHLDPDPAFTKAYNQRLQEAMKDMVFSGGCNAWYTDDDDYNYTLWPYSAWRFIRELDHVNLEEFRVTKRAVG